jgi:hypothetical protein
VLYHQREHKYLSSKLFGIRYNMALSNTEKAFNEAGIPNWKSNIRTNIAEARNDVNRIIQPILEYEFSELREQTKWKSASPERRKEYIYQRINDSKRLVKEILANSFDPEDTRTLMLYKLGAGEYANQRRLKSYAKEFGIEEEFTELDDNMLKLFVGYVEVREDYRKADVKE